MKQRTNAHTRTVLVKQQRTANSAVPIVNLLRAARQFPVNAGTLDAAANLQVRSLTRRRDERRRQDRGEIRR